MTVISRAGGAVPARQNTTTSVAQGLRQLAAETEELARRSGVASIAHEPMRALADYLCLRARLIEVECRAAVSEAHSARRPDAVEIEARFRDAAGHDGDPSIAARALVDGLDLGGLMHVATIAIIRERSAERAFARGGDLVSEIREHAREREQWNLQRALDELESVLARARL
jgi:hypothetical protein